MRDKDYKLLFGSEEVTTEVLQKFNTDIKSIKLAHQQIASLMQNGTIEDLVTWFQVNKNNNASFVVCSVLLHSYLLFLKDYTAMAKAQPKDELDNIIDKYRKAPVYN